MVYLAQAAPKAGTKGLNVTQPMDNLLLLFPKMFPLYMACLTTKSLHSEVRQFLESKFSEEYLTQSCDSEPTIVISFNKSQNLGTVYGNTLHSNACESLPSTPVPPYHSTRLEYDFYIQIHLIIHA
jgi:hypothetical protein